MDYKWVTAHQRRIVKNLQITTDQYNLRIDYRVMEYGVDK